MRQTPPLVSAAVAASWMSLASSQSCSLMGVDRPEDPINISSDDIKHILSVSPVTHRVVFEVKPLFEEYETPLQFRISNAVDVGMYSVAAAYDQVALEHGGRVDVSELHRVFDPNCTKNEIRVHCKLAIFLGFAYIVPLLAPKTLPVLEDYLADRFKGTNMVAAYTQMTNPSFDACNNLQLPWGLARCILDELVEYVDESDGWNAKGTLNRTWNARPFADFDYTDSHGNQYHAYQVQDDLQYWKPLMEANGLGYFCRQEHVTPYIGLTGKLYGIDGNQCEFLNSRRALSPNYTSIFGSDLDWVLEQTRIMANDEEKQMLVEAFDRKLFSLFLFAIYWTGTQEYDELQFWKFKAAFSMVIYDAIIMVWREKIRYNRVRPTTIAQGRPDTTDTFAGVPGASRTIPVNEWEPYIRVMPHAEYPSGSACMCQAFADLMVRVSGTDDISPNIARLHVAAGSSKIFPGQVPSKHMTFQWTKWSDMVVSCATSRTDGGMHYEDSVHAGRQLCTGFAHQIFDKLDRLVAGNATGGGVIDHSDTEVHVCPFSVT